ncbi:MAG: transposase [Candidatus Pacebacteria bacterium]|nr:transposase [Candidatus Paceibacterota bacterium]
MPRSPRVDVGNELYHVINRANARLPIFFKEEDFELFVSILEDAQKKYDMRIIAYCLMPNHFHLVLYPRQDNDLQKFMQWVTLTHTQRWHIHNKTIGSGHLYQGRYKSFLIEGDKHLLSVIRYVERNPLRAKLVKKAENWKFNSLSYRLFKNTNKKLLSKWPIEEPKDYLSFVNTPQTNFEEESIRIPIIKSNPFGSIDWSIKTIKKFGLESTIRQKGRPRKGT